MEKIEALRRPRFGKIITALEASKDLYSYNKLYYYKEPNIENRKRNEYYLVYERSVKRPECKGLIPFVAFSEACDGLRVGFCIKPEELLIEVLEPMWFIIPFNVGNDREPVGGKRKHTVINTGEGD